MTLLALLGFELLRPVDLAWLLIVPAVAVLGVRGLRLSDAEARAMVAPSRLERFFGGLVPGATRLRLGLAVAGLALLALAVTGPVRGFTLREVERKGLDLIVALDASKSMLVPDLGRTRLEEAKRQVKALFPRLQGDRVALISFSGEARRIAPLTRDHTTLGWFLDGVDPGDHALGGTDLAAALQEALDLFDGRSGSHEAIVLITDGEDHGGRGLELAEEASRRGIAVHVLGVGTELGGKIPRPDGGWVVGPDGAEVVSRLVPDTLEAIARVSGGRYRGTEGSVLALERLYEESIGTMEGRTYDRGLERIPHDRFQWPLVLGLVCLITSLALRAHRPLLTEELA